MAEGIYIFFDYITVTYCDTDEVTRVLGWDLPKALAGKWWQQRRQTSCQCDI